MLTLVDSNVLLDIISENQTWQSWSAQALLNCLEDGDLCINAIIYAEISTDFDEMEEVDLALPASLVQRVPIPIEAAFLAGKVHLDYRRKGGTRICALPDFFIGAHAAVTQMRLLTRDPRRYRTYFPRVELIAPDDADITRQEP